MPTEPLRAATRNRAPPPAPRTARLAAARDFAILFGLLVLGLVAWLVPERRWGSIVRLCAPVVLRFLPAGTHSSVERIRRLAGSRLAGRSPEAVAAAVLAGYVVDNLQILKSYRPGGWEPVIRLVGVEHLERALARGRGAILWVGHFSFYSLVTKMALHRAGFAVTHLSHPGHGFSGTYLGMRLLNPIRSRIEDRYLKERVLMSFTNPVPALRRLHDRLRENGVVSIVARGLAWRPASVALLSGHIPLGSGAADLAHATGAALLPVFTLGEGTGAFRVTVEPPLEVPEEAPHREAVERTLRQYAERLESYALAHAGEWLGWLGP